MQIKLYSICETTLWHVNGKWIWQISGPISIKGKRIDSANCIIIDTVGFLGEILDQTTENLVCGLQAWNKEVVMSRKQLGLPWATFIQAQYHSLWCEGCSENAAEVAYQNFSEATLQDSSS